MWLIAASYISALPGSLREKALPLLNKSNNRHPIKLVVYVGEVEADATAM